MSSLDQLCGTRPPWVDLLNNQRMLLMVAAIAQRPSGIGGRTYSLSIELRKDDQVYVSEIASEAQLPRCCVERHVTSDASLYLHLNATKPIQNAAMARAWWYSLGFFLNNQDYATRRRKWPIIVQLGHEDPATTQLEMEGLAERLGWKEETLSSIFRNRGWLVGCLTRVIKETIQLANARAPCPRRCTRKHQPSRNRSCEYLECVDKCKKVRKQIFLVDCPLRSIVEQIVLLEHKRRLQEHTCFQNLMSDVSAFGTN